MVVSLEPSTGLVIGAIQVRLELENVHGIADASQLTIYLGDRAVDSAQVEFIEEFQSGNIVLLFTIPQASTVGVAAVQVVFAASSGQSTAQCSLSACPDGGFVYTTITGPAVVTFGPVPGSIQSTAVGNAVQLGASNFLPVADASLLELSCDGVAIPNAVTSYQGSSSESFFTLTLPAFHPVVGVAACVLQQTTGTQNALSFELTISEPQISVSQVRPAASVGVGTVVTVQILNLVAADLVWEAPAGVWNPVSLSSSVTQDRIQQDSNGVWQSGVQVQFSMFDAGTSGPITVAVRVPGAVENKDTFVLDFVKDSARLVAVSPEYDSVCGGSTITASFSDAEAFSQSGLVLRAFGESAESQDVTADTWDSATGQATFTVPQSIGQTAGFRQMQVRYAPESFVSGNFAFEYLSSNPLIVSTSPKTRNNVISLIPAQMTTVTIRLEGLGVLTQGDLSLTLSRAGVHASLTAIEFTRVDGLTTVKFTPPAGTSIGLHTLTIASESCLVSSISINLNMLEFLVMNMQSRVSNIGGDTTTLVIENAPHSVDLPFDCVTCITIECGSSTATVNHVGTWSVASTTVVFAAPSGTVADGETETATSCHIYRTADPSKAGPTFELIYYLSTAPYVADQDSLEQTATGNQFGGRRLRVVVGNLPASSIGTDLSVKFGSMPAASVVLVSQSSGFAVLQMSSPANNNKTDCMLHPTKTVTISSVSNPDQTASFLFSYVWKDAPKIVSVQPASAEVTSGTQLTVQLKDISAYSQAEDVTVVFQQSHESSCSNLQLDSTTGIWSCFVTLHSGGLTPTAGSSAEATGISVYTAQQGLSKSAHHEFTYLQSNVPVYLSHYPIEGSGSSAFTSVQFDNYCLEHDHADYSVSCAAAGYTVAAIVESYTYSDCVTTLALSFPASNDAFSATCTVHIQTSEAFQFGFNFMSSLIVKSSLESAVAGSAPEIVLTLVNLKSASSSTVCAESDCAEDHNISVMFGTHTADLLQGPSSCSAGGTCRITVLAPALSDSVVVSVSNHPLQSGAVSADNTASFNLQVFTYECESYCLNQGKIEDRNLIASVPPSSATCVDSYCKEKPFRSPVVTSIFNPSAAGGVAECRHTQNCQVQLTTSQVSSEILTAETISDQIFVTFGHSQTPAHSITLTSQVGDQVILTVTTPIMNAPSDSSDVTVSGYDESRQMLVARATDGF